MFRAPSGTWTPYMTAPPGACAHEGVPWPVRWSPHGERRNMAPAGRYSMKAVVRARGTLTHRQGDEHGAGQCYSGRGCGRVLMARRSSVARCPSAARPSGDGGQSQAEHLAQVDDAVLDEVAGNASPAPLARAANQHDDAAKRSYGEYWPHVVTTPSQAMVRPPTIVWRNGVE